MERYDQWNKAKRALEDAQSWFSMKGKAAGYQDDIFTLGCVTATTFNLCGQRYAGGQNYWPSPKEFNEAFTIAIAANFDRLAKDAISILEEREQKALIACEEEITAMRETITLAKAESEKP